MIINAHKDKLLSLLLVAGIAIIYWNVAGFEFIDLDDGEYVFENQKVIGGITLEGIKWAFKFPNYVYWHPLAWLSHMLDCELFGLNPGAHHVVNVLLHAINAILLFAILRIFTGSRYKSFFVAALFAFHPLNVESVVWVAERKNLLSTLFFFLTLATYALHVQNKRSFPYWCSIFLFILGLMVKPMLVVLPIILLLLDFWPLNRFREITFSHSNASVDSQKGGTISVYHLLLNKIPFILISILFCVLTVLSSRQGDFHISFDLVPFSTRIVNSVIWYLGYIGNLLWPHNLTVFEPYPKYVVSYWASMAVTLWLVCFSVLVYRLRNRFPYLLTGWFWYLCALIPVIGIMQQGLWAAMADRFAYLPQVGFFIMITWGVSDLFQRMRRFATVPKVAAFTAITILMGATWVQVQYWKDSVTLFQRSLELTPNSAALHTMLGYSIGSAGRPEEGRPHYMHALQIDPTYPYANHYLGYLAAKEGRLEAAQMYFRKAIEYSVHDHSHYSLGVVLIKLNKPVEAAYHFRECLRINPEYTKASDGLAIALKMSGGIQK